MNAKVLAVFLGALVCALVWMGALAPLVARSFGVPTKAGFWRLDRKNQHLSKRQYFWCFGLLDFGLGLFLLTTLVDLFSWKFLGDEASHRSPGRIAANLALWMVLGAAIGFFPPRGSTTDQGNK